MPGHCCPCGVSYNIPVFYEQGDVMLTLTLGLFLLAGPTDKAASDDVWPQWRGPASQGISAETKLPVEWSASKNLAWKAALAFKCNYYSISTHASGDATHGQWVTKEYCRG